VDGIRWYAKCCFPRDMNAEALDERSPSVSDAENLAGARHGHTRADCRRVSPFDRWRVLAASSAPLLYRGITGRLGVSICADAVAVRAA
jgi:hypothetical protein